MPSSNSRVAERHYGNVSAHFMFHVGNPTLNKYKMNPSVPSKLALSLWCMYVGHTAAHGSDYNMCRGLSNKCWEYQGAHPSTLQTCVTLISLIAWSRSPTISAAGRLGGQRSRWISLPGCELSHQLSIFCHFTADHLQNDGKYWSMLNKEAIPAPKLWL